MKIKNISKKIIPALLCGALALSAGCAQKQGQEQPGNGGLKVVTVNFPPYDFIKEISGGDVVPSMLLRGGQDAHSYEPTAKDIIRISEADLFVYTGGESDTWVDTIMDSIEGDVEIIRIMDFVELLEEEEDEEEPEEHDHEHEYDEHIWTSPKNAVRISGGLAEAMCAADPENAEKYRAGLERYTTELNGLSDELQAAADTLTEPLIFGDRFPFAYMARDYGIEYYAAFAGCSADTEPSAAKMTFLIDKAKETGAKHIYHIEFSTGKVAEAIAEASGADIRLMHSCHTVSDDDLSAGESYISIMRKNILAMKG